MTLFLILIIVTGIVGMVLAWRTLHPKPEPEFPEDTDFLGTVYPAAADYTPLSSVNMDRDNIPVLGKRVDTDQVTDATALFLSLTLRYGLGQMHYDQGSMQWIVQIGEHSFSGDTELDALRRAHKQMQNLTQGQADTE